MLACSGFIVLTLTFATLWFAHNINPDATAYFTIAQKYSVFDIKGATNAYWGPLFSWVLVPAIWLGFARDLDLVSRAVTTLAGVLILITTYWFLLRKGASKVLANSLCVLLGLLLFCWTLFGAISPDIIFSLLVLWFSLGLARFTKKPSRNLAMLLGVIGALLFFTKGFGLYLFIAVTGFVAIWQVIKTKKLVAVLKTYLPVAATLLILILPFILLVSLKYDSFTINSTGSYVQRAFGPEVRAQHPMLSAGPFEPPNETANTVWEDPTTMINRMPDWSPLDSRDNLNYFFNMFGNNLQVSLQAIKDNGALLVLAAIVLMIGCIRGKLKMHYRLFALASATMLAAYALLLTEPRYLWPAMILAVLALGLWLSELEQKGILKKSQIVVVAVLSFIVAILPLPQQIASSYASSKGLHDQALDLKAVLPAGSRVIADNFMQYHTCYYLNLRCYAVLQNPPQYYEKTYIAELKASKIEYFVNYKTRNEEPGYNDFIHRNFDIVATRDFDSKHKSVPEQIIIYRLR